MKIQENQIIGELVANDYRAASIFKKYSIDFCCQGNRTIGNACEKKNIESHSLLSDLNNALESRDSETIDYKTWPLDLLVDYIEKKHHRYVEEKTPELKAYLDKISKVHGERHPELIDVRNEFFASAGELAQHMKKEELILFPFIRKMLSNKGEQMSAPHFGTVNNPINMMMDEHSAEGERYRKIALLTDNYTPPEDACNTYRVAFALLNEFEQDLHLHIHLENNILFPRAIAMEKERIATVTV
jgi:regulator of cell morphogenesis and NO signaling